MCGFWQIYNDTESFIVSYKYSVSALKILCSAYLSLPLSPSPLQPQIFGSPPQLCLLSGLISILMLPALNFTPLSLATCPSWNTTHILYPTMIHQNNQYWPLPKINQRLVFEYLGSEPLPYPSPNASKSPQGLILYTAQTLYTIEGKSSEQLILGSVSSGGLLTHDRGQMGKKLSKLSSTMIYTREVRIESRDFKEEQNEAPFN